MRRWLLAALIALAPGLAWGQANVPTGGGSTPTAAPGTSASSALPVQGVIGGVPVDGNGAPFQGEVAMTVGTTYAAQRSLKAICTAAGNVSVTYTDSSTGVWAAAVGTNTFPVAATAVNASGTTATCTYSNLK